MSASCIRVSCQKSTASSLVEPERALQDHFVGDRQAVGRIAARDRHQHAVALDEVEQEQPAKLVDDVLDVGAGGPAVAPDGHREDRLEVGHRRRHTALGEQPGDDGADADAIGRVGQVDQGVEPVQADQQPARRIERLERSRETGERAGERIPATLARPQEGQRPTLVGSEVLVVPLA
jgi:hypothetical protein